MCCYSGGVPDSHLAWGLLPTRGKPLLASAWGKQKASWSFLLKEAWYLGPLQRRTPSCYLRWVLLSAEGHQTPQVTGGSPKQIPEERIPTLKRQKSLGKYLVGVSGGKFTRVWLCAEPRRPFILQHIPLQTATKAPGATLLRAAGDHAL